MKKSIIILFAAVLLWSMPNVSSASGVAGMDLTLTCVGGNNYLIRMALYRDCSGIAAPTTAAFVIQCASNPTLNFNVTGVPLTAGSGAHVSPVCSNWNTTCTGGSHYGIEEYVYETTVTLPPCADWRIGWSGSAANLNGLCCRNQSTTILNPTSQTAYIELTLNNLVASCISTIVHSSPPLAGLCSGQLRCINFGGIDPDGDSLSYDFVNPMTNGNNGVLNWLPPFSPIQPFPSSPPITVNPVTGQICMTPTTTALISPMQLRIRKWRNIQGQSVLLATSYRDIQMIISTCSNQLPVLGGMDTTLANGYSIYDTDFYTYHCVGDTLRFAIWGYDPDSPDPTWGDPDKFSISWDQGIPQGTFQAFHNHTDSAYAIFTWVPLPQDAGLVHSFKATIRDGACPYNGINTSTYSVIVQGMLVDIGNDTVLCRGESVTFHAATSTPAVNHIWFLNGVPTGTPLNSTSFTLNTSNLQPGQHIVSIQTNDGGTTMLCPGMDQVVVTVVEIPKPNLGNDTVLTNTSPPLILDAGPGAQYHWNTGDTTQYIMVTNTGLYVVVVDGGYGTHCTGTDSIYVEWLISIDEMSPSQPMVVFPNPATGEITLELSPMAEPPHTLRIYSPEGKELLRQSLHHDVHQMKHTFNISQLPSGVYLLVFETPSGRITKRLVVK
jgi:hypothetical protein